MRAGAAKACINPPAAIALAGYATEHRPSVGIHDDLHMRVVIIEDNQEKRTAFVNCDLLGFSNQQASRIRNLVAEEIGASATDVFVACTHTHSAPTTGLLAFDSDEGAKDYLAFVYDKAVEAARAAVQHMRPAWLATGKIQPHAWGFNRNTLADPSDPLFSRTRHYLDVLGTPKRSARADDVIDPELLVTWLSEEDGTTIATLVNYACHPVVLGPDNQFVSADYPGALAAVVEREVGGISLFLNGAAGDIDPIVNRDFGWGNGRFLDVWHMGEALARSVMRTRPLGTEFTDEVSLISIEEEVSLAVQSYPDLDRVRKWEQHYKDMLETLQAQGASPGELTVARRFHDWTCELKTGLEQNQLPNTVLCPLSLIGWRGEEQTAFIGFGGELFAEIGLDIKAKAPKSVQPIVVSYVNGYVGYLGTPHAYDMSTYEVTLAPILSGTYSLSSDTAERLKAAADRLWANFTE